MWLGAGFIGSNPICHVLSLNKDYSALNLILPIGCVYATRQELRFHYLCAMESYDRSQNGFTSQMTDL